MPRTYADPLDLVWLHTAEALGMRVVRSADVYAAWDGAGTLTLSSSEHFDPDDSLAQLIFHEICHALAEGPEKFDQPDWGLENFENLDWCKEHAALRLQAALADRHGLRALLAATTDYRPYWYSLPEDPLAPSDDPALPQALAAWDRATTGPWAEAIDRALRATAHLRDVAAPFAPADSAWAR